MKKRKEDIGNPAVLTRVFFVSVFIILVISYLYLSFFDSGLNLQFSPDEGIVSAENGLVLLRGLGNEGIEWYCGVRESFTDTKGNTYGLIELGELKKILGNDEFLRGELCDSI